MTHELIKRVHGPTAALRHAEEVRAQLADLGIGQQRIEQQIACDVFAESVVSEVLAEFRAETHVVVGDHTPEPR